MARQQKLLLMLPAKPEIFPLIKLIDKIVIFLTMLRIIIKRMLFDSNGYPK